jgi:serine/threonine protein kinase
MCYCLNPVCQHPQNPNHLKSCQNCGASLLLRQRYQALRPIGQGGFGRTFLAVDLAQDLKPRCVIKQFFPQQQGTDNREKASELFRQEADRLAELGNHPHIPTLLDALEQADYQYLIQEFIEGQNLAQELQAGVTYSQKQVVPLLETLLETVAFMHTHHVIHRDIKPANIIHTTDDRFVLVDLGAAKVATGTALAQTGTVIGSAEYVAPEQLRGKAIFASDLYSLGVTCVTLLTGMSPFDLYDTIAGSWSWRNYLRQPVSERFGRILDRLIATPTGQRYAAADLALRDLSNWQQQLPYYYQPKATIDPWQRDSGLDEATRSETDPAINFDRPGGLAAVEDDWNEAQEQGQIVHSKKKLFLRVYTLFASLMIGAWIATLKPFQENNAPVPPIPINSGPVSTIQLPLPTDQLSQPRYRNSVAPFQRLNNVEPFAMMRLADGGKTIVTGSPKENGQYMFNFFDVATQQKRSFTISVMRDQIHDTAFAIQGNILLFSTYPKATTQIWHLKTQTQIKLLSEFAQQSFVFPSLDGQFITFMKGKNPGLAKVLANGQITQSVILEGAQNIFDGGGFSPDNSTIFGQPNPGAAPMGWSTQTGKVTIQLQNPPDYMSVWSMFRVGQSPSQGFVVATERSTQPHMLAIWDMKTKQFLGRLNLGDRIGDLAVSPDAQTLVVQAGKNLTVWDLPSQKLLRKIPIKFYGTVQFSNDGKTLFLGVVGSVAPEISLWHVQQLRHP